MYFNNVGERMMNLVSLIEEGCEEVGEVVRKCWGDRRAFPSRVWVGEDFIMVAKKDDRVLQYYGGFQYVDELHRVEVGDRVMYHVGDSDNRVQSVLDAVRNEFENE